MENNKKKLKEKLAEVIVSDELNIDILLDIVKSFIKVNPAKNQVIPLPDFLLLKYKDAIIITLLGFKLLKELKVRDVDIAGPKEISQNSGINLSTVKNALRELENERLAISTKGKYTISNFLLYVLRDKFATLKLEKLSPKASKKKRVSKRVDFSGISKILGTNPEEFAGPFYEFLTEKKGEYFKKSLILIKLAKDKFDIDGLTSAEITKILQDHLRVPAIYQPNISTALGARGTSKYVLKQATKSKKVFIYKLTKLGEDFTNNTNLQQKKK